MPNRVKRNRAITFSCFALAMIGQASAGAALRVQVVDQHGNPLQNAVVTAAAEDGAPPATANPEIAQVNQQFAPRVSVVPRGSDVHFPNRDTTQHHVYSFSEPKQFEIELYSGDSAAPVRFDNAGIVALGCNIHDWMLGYVLVTDDPYYAVTAQDGRVQFDADTVAALTAWHPAATDPSPGHWPLANVPRNADGSYRLEIEVSAADPLEFTLDPLQDLFGEAPR